MGEWAASIADALVALEARIGSAANNGSLPRTALAVESQVTRQVPISSVKAVDGAALGVSEDSADLYINVASNVWRLRGRTPVGATEACAGIFQYVLPPDYVPGTSLLVLLRTQLVTNLGGGAGTNNASSVDVEAFEQSTSAAVGSDICATAAQTFTAPNAWESKSFTITGTGLLVGDIVNFRVTTTAIESGASQPIQIEIASILIRHDVRG